MKVKRQKKKSTNENSVNDILSEIKDGNDSRFDELCKLYRPLVERSALSAAERYSGYGAETDDFRQECILALYNAAKKYNTEQSEVTFGLYAKICLRNRIISVGRKLTKRTASVKSDSAIPDYDIARGADDSAPSAGYTFTDEMLDCFSRYEREVWKLYIKGFSYSDIAAKLKKSEKSIDNAVYRVRSKLKKTAR